MLSNLLKAIWANFFTILVLVALTTGWLRRDNNYLSAETGTGYILGIIGGSLMIILLLYPLSKRLPLLTRFIPIRYWFGIHMFLGTVGPVLILFHSNFKLGSANSSIALVCMLLVAGSGVFGRYFYTRIHHGLYGTSLTLKELKQKMTEEHTELIHIYAEDEKLNNQLQKMEESALQPYSNLLKSLWHIITLAFNTPRMKRKIMRSLKKSNQQNSKDNVSPDSKVVEHLLKHYMFALKRAAAFRVYERLFSLWHIFHLPLFFMMLITATIHIFAVHMY